MLLVSKKKSINKPHSSFKPQGSKLGKKVAAYSPEITVISLTLKKAIYSIVITITVVAVVVITMIITIIIIITLKGAI